jgi:hypothetical protein
MAQVLHLGHLHQTSHPTVHLAGPHRPVPGNNPTPIVHHNSPLATTAPTLPQAPSRATAAVEVEAEVGLVEALAVVQGTVNG